jgi:phosphohistidine swiveling domain-containing protein
MNFRSSVRSSLPRLRAQGLRMFLGKANMPKSDQDVDKKTEEGKVLIKNAVLNKMVYTELILSIDL